MCLIMLWGNFDDRPLQVIRTCLRDKNGVELIEVDQHSPSDLGFDLEVSNNIDGNVYIKNKAYALSDISGVYLRPYRTIETDPKITIERATRIKEYRARVEHVLSSWLEVTDALVINKFSAMASNCSKPYQAALIRQSGFKTPKTIITTSVEKVKDFVSQYEDVIYKSISGVRSIVSRLTEKKLHQLGDVKWVPTQFQEQVKGTDYRVHVIGHKTICSKIETDADDYRYAGSTGHDIAIKACRLPLEVECNCIDLTRRLGLLVAGVDLRHTPEGEWYCFEVNPSPGFTYYQDHTGQDIANEICNLLTSGREKPFVIGADKINTLKPQVKRSNAYVT